MRLVGSKTLLLKSWQRRWERSKALDRIDRGMKDGF